MTLTSDAETRLANVLADLRQSGRRQSGLYAELVPPNPATAYRVAAGVAERLGWPIGGWKIAANKPEMQAALRADEPIMGRVFQHMIHESGVTLEHAPLLWPVIEGELVVSLGSDLPPRDRSYRQEEVEAAVAAIHVGVEVAECRFVHDDAFPPLPAILADGSGSGHLVLGPAIDDWRQRNLGSADVKLSVDGDVRRTGNVGTAIGHPLISVTWLANRLSVDGIGLFTGQVISTGTCTGMLLAKAGTGCVATFEGLGTVEVAFQ
jgi:2-keto-4-pentenoate hydratase